MRRRSTCHTPNPERGQYMVEFGLTFVFFIFVILAAINMLIAGYNYNTAQRAVWEAARKAAVGGSDTEILYVLHDEFTSKFIGGALLQAKLDKSADDIISVDALNRSEGTPVTIAMNYTMGFSLGIFPMVIVPFKVESTLAVIAENDLDRDGLVDRYEAAFGFFTNDADNDGTTDSLETDLDGDGYADANDWGVIYTDTGTGTPYLWHNVTGTSSSPGALTNRYYFARERFVTQFGDVIYGPHPFRPQYVPQNLSGNEELAVMVDLRRDADNDGWETKWDVNDAATNWGSGKNTVNLP